MIIRLDSRDELGQLYVYKSLSEANLRSGGPTWDPHNPPAPTANYWLWEDGQQMLWEDGTEAEWEE